MSDGTHPTGGVFLSYAREDAGAARRIAEAMRAFGVEVWFDENELRGGDTWDAKIRNQIRGCALFIPIISATTQARDEGYFRREWRVALERIQDMAAGVPFLLPVVIDDTPEKGSLVPDEFMRVQWTRMHKGIPSPQFVDHVRKLLAERSWKTGHGKTADASPVAAAPKSASGRPAWIWALVAIMVIAAVAGVLLLRQPASTAAAGPLPKAATPAPALPAAPEKSIAVLPFANLSTDKENEFFADGVHDDVITNLAKIRDLKVISRTSVLAYRDLAARNLRKIAAELGVATILEGSIRRVGNKVHMNAQLIDARTDEHLWADTFDGDTDDIFALQAKLAQQIATALKANLTAGEKTLIERRPTQNQEAYELFLRGRVLDSALSGSDTRDKYEAVCALYERARDLDPAFALVHVQLTVLYGTMYWFGSVDPTPERRILAERELAAAQKLSPDSPETHFARGAFAYMFENNWERALQEYALAEAGLPNDARLKYLIGIADRRLGRWPQAVESFDRAADLNPNELVVLTTQIETLAVVRRYQRVHDLVVRYLALFPDSELLQAAVVQSKFALDGNVTTYRQALAALPPSRADPFGLEKRYAIAQLDGDPQEAERVLADPRLKVILNSNSVVNDPAAFHRAMVALWRGDQAAARKFGEEAIAAYEAGHWTPRQQAVVRLYTALARTMAGQVENGLRDVQAARQALAERDKFLGIVSMPAVAETLALLGRRDEALDCLREYLAGPSDFSPNELRINPFFASLKSDPRFEEILKSAKPL